MYLFKTKELDAPELSELFEVSLLTHFLILLLFLLPSTGQTLWTGFTPFTICCHQTL